MFRLGILIFFYTLSPFNKGTIGNQYLIKYGKKTKQSSSKKEGSTRESEGKTFEKACG